MDKFKYTYSAPTAEEKKQVQKIQSQYMPKEQNDNDEKISRLKVLDNKVKLPCKIASSIIGVIGFFCFGGGMAMTMESPYVVWGAILGIVGLALMAIAYPIYNKMLAKRKAKYGAQILELSQSILQEGKQENVSLDIKQIDGKEDFKENKDGD